MFGLSRREQRWKAEHQAAELAVTLILGVIEIAVALRNRECIELEKPVSKQKNRKRRNKP